MEESTPNLRQKESKKRRSSIFQRRSITGNTTEELDETKNTNDKSPTSKEDPKVAMEIEEFDLQAYINDLKSEKQIWQEVYKERKAQIRNLAKRKMTLEKTGQEVDLSMLTESERNFIEARPNYEQIVKNSKALVDVAVQVAVLNQHCNRLYDNLNSKLERKIKDATKKIISMID